MPRTRLPDLVMGDLVANPPIVQGGMGVRISRAGLASAVANEGGIGVIAAVGLGDFEHQPCTRYATINADALRRELRAARERTTGIIGVNIMVALTDYASLVRAAVEEGADIIFSGAGLPLALPELAAGARTKLVPIVSSGRAARLIAKKWARQHRVPDAFVIEGPRAGGHLGFTREDLDRGKAPELDALLSEVLEVADGIARGCGRPVPVIAAGGLFDGADIARVLSRGAGGAQLGSRFVCTDECDADLAFKMVFVNSTERDVALIDSPVGMPGRVFRNSFIAHLEAGHKHRVVCRYRCLLTCNPKEVPYCIAEALTNAAAGRVEEGFVFCGTEGWRIDRIVPVRDLMAELVAHAEVALGLRPARVPACPSDEGSARGV